MFGSFYTFWKQSQNFNFMSDNPRTFNLTGFGNIDLKSDSSYFTKYSLNNLQFDLILHTYGIAPNEICVDQYESFIAHVGEYISIVEQEIRKEYENDPDGSVREYIELHLQEISPQTIQEIIQDTNSSLSIEERLYSKLRLEAIAISQQSENPKSYATWDFSIGKDVSDMMIAVTTDSKGNVLNITIEN